MDFFRSIFEENKYPSDGRWIPQIAVIRFAIQTILNPLLWNVVSRNEYRHKSLTNIFAGNKYIACSIVALCTFLAGIWRDYLFKGVVEQSSGTLVELLDMALTSQIGATGKISSFVPVFLLNLLPAVKGMNNVEILGFMCQFIVGGPLIVFGSILVLTSSYKLGILPTYMGDYFGIMPHSEPISSFPFSMYNNPMYVGSTLIFLGSAFWYKSAIGVALSEFVWMVYWIACLFEEPFTAMIYSKLSKSKSSRRTGSRASSKRSTPSKLASRAESPAVEGSPRRSARKRRV